MKYAIILHQIHGEQFLHHWYLVDNNEKQEWLEKDKKNPAYSKVITFNFKNYEEAQEEIRKVYAYARNETPSIIMQKMEEKIKDQLQAETALIESQRERFI